MKKVGSIALTAAVLLCSHYAVAKERCPTTSAIGASADPAEDLLLEFARAYARLAGLPDLRRLPSVSGEMHVRLWYGFGLAPVEGFVLHRTGARWAAHTVTPVNRSGCYEQRQISVPVNWELTWQSVEALGLRALPRKPARNPNLVVTDGHSYVLEWWLDGRYRAYVYDNPDVFKTSEDTQMIAIARQLLGPIGVKAPAEIK